MPQDTTLPSQKIFFQITPINFQETLVLNQVVFNQQYIAIYNFLLDPVKLNPTQIKRIESFNY